MNLSLVKIGVALVIALALISAWLIYGGSDDTGPSPATTPTNTTTSTTANTSTLVQYATQPSIAKGPIVSNVITTATKLGQGQNATADLPRATDFERPRLNSNDAGTALLVPGSALPASNWVQHIKGLEPLTTGQQPRLKFDIYSWSQGTLAATTPQWVDLAEVDAETTVPPMLLGHVQQLTKSERVMLVIAPQAGKDQGRYAAPLNPHDAYVVVADVLVPDR